MTAKIVWKDHNIRLKPYEQTAKKKRQKQRYCRICGAPIFSGDMCANCSKFIQQKKREEGKKKK